MTEKLVALRIRATKYVEGRAIADRERGQGSLEYVGAIVVAALIIVAVYGAVSGKATEVGNAVKTAIDHFLKG